MNREDDPKKVNNDKTLESIKIFKEIMDQEIQKQKKAYPDKKVDYYKVLRNSCFWAFTSEIRFCVIHATISESCGVFYSFYIGSMIKFIKSDDSDISYGVQLVSIFFVSQVIA